MKANFSEKMIWRNPWYFLAFGFGSGTLPFMPGTFGTLAAIPLYLLVKDFSLPIYAGLLTIFILLGFWWCGLAEKFVGVHDYPGIVWDEIVGYLLTMLNAPQGWFWIIFGFVVFRIFDIVKPWPLDWVNRKVKGGVGIVLDDLLAGVYAWIILQMLASVVLFYS
jgi:phosphatidylglycerophosphatase A